ncbi:MAG: hypothetical protein IT453_15170 [Planctomycetes bacterium]|nr:hypothetical protein [Planctomycetota bacterium]
MDVQSATAASQSSAEPTAPSTAAPAPQAPTLTPDEVRARLSTRFEGALLDTANGQDFFQTQGYMKLLSAVSQFSPEDAAARASRALDWHAAMAAPDEWRGEWVTFRGQLGSLAAEKLVSTVDGREHVWRAIVLNDTEGEKEPPEGGVFVDLLERPEGEFDPRREVVDVVGVFYRTVAYENYQGLPRQAGYLIGRTLKRVEKDVAKRTEMPWWGILVIGGGVAVGALHLVNILRGRSRRRPRDEELASTDFHKMFQARTKGLPPKSRPGSPHS